MQLKNKVAYVTGGASGIGAAICKYLAVEGASVVIADMNLEQAQQLNLELDKSQQQSHLAIQIDVSNEEQVNASVEQTIKQLGGIDILVSNAGIQTIAPIHELSFQQWKKNISINLDGAFLMTKACLQHMYPKKSGKIIYIGSVHSKLASALKAPYVTAKHGLTGLNKVVAKEAAKYNVASHLVCPGYVKTPLVEKQIPEQAEKLGISEAEVIRNVLLKGTADAEFTTIDEVAKCVTFLATFEGLALTGQSFIVSHGWCME